MSTLTLTSMPDAICNNASFNMFDDEVQIPEANVPVKVWFKKSSDWRSVTPSMVFSYRNPTDESLIGCNLRFDDGCKKRFFFIQYKVAANQADSGWYEEYPSKPRPLYGIERLAKHPDSLVIIAEGEKAADAAYRLTGLPTITWLGGIQGVAHADWDSIINREVILWPDADSQEDELGNRKPRDKQPGTAAMLEIYKHLYKGNNKVKMINVDFNDQLKDGFDVADAEMNGWTKEQALTFIDQQSQDPHASQIPCVTQNGLCEIEYNFG